MTLAFTVRTPLLLLPALISVGCLGHAPVHPEARRHTDQCAALISTARWDQARVHCEHALEFSPGFADAWVNLGLIASAQGRTDEARKHYITALRNNQESAQAYNNLGALDLERGQLEMARDRFLRALQVDPDYHEARRNLGVAYTRMGRLEEADKAYRHLIAVDPQLSEPYLALGGLALLRADPAAAAAWFEQAVELEVGDTAAWKGLAVSREQLGRARAAHEAFETCVDLDDRDPDCRQGLERTARPFPQVE